MKTIEYTTSLSILKKGIWLYFFLLLFEGAFRKWILPGLAGPLLVIRDPLAIVLLIIALKYGIWRPNYVIILMWGISGLASIASLVVGHQNVVITLYGLRIMLFHFPLIFLIGTVFDRVDVLQMGKVLLWLNIGMTILVALQFYSPQSAWVNRGIGGDLEGSGFGGASGFFRVPGTFSFTNGLSSFYGLVTAYLIYFWLNRVKRKFMPPELLIMSTIALLAAIPLSISRAVFFSVILSIIFVLPLLLQKPKLLGRLLMVALFAMLTVFLLNNFSFFETATKAFTERFTSANESEGGLEGVFLDRFLGGMVGVFTGKEDTPLWGYGIGMGSNVAAQLMTGERTFLIAEGEWSRTIGEVGLILGLLTIGIRCTVGLKMVHKAWVNLKRQHSLPWMLLSFAFLNMIQGSWAQPTALGFAVLSGGLVIGAMRNRVKTMIGK